MAPGTPELNADWFSRHPLMVAWDLVGAVLTVIRADGVISGRIVEVEAYAGPNDLASHSGRLAVARSALSGEVGRLYMYRSYGIHAMANIVAHQDGRAGGILLRAAEPVSGLKLIDARRAVATPTPLTGPGSLCQGMDIRLSDFGHSLLDQESISLSLGLPLGTLMCGPRIGITRGLSAQWRLFEPGNVHVSRSRTGRLIERASLQSLIPAEGTVIS